MPSSINAPGAPEHDKYVERLKEALSEGVLSLAEFESKLSDFYASQADNLDLLEARPVRGPERSSRRWAAVTVALIGLFLFGLLLAVVVNSRTTPAKPADRASEPTSQGHGGSPATARTAIAQPTAGASAPSGPAPTSQANGWATLPSSTPSNGTIAIVGLGPGATLTVDNGQQSVTYRTCRGFQALTPAGTVAGFAALSVGDFGNITLGPDATCLTLFQVVAPPAVEECTGGPGLPGYGVFHWEGFNAGAHSVVVLTTSGSQLEAWRWCTMPTSVAASGVATTMSGIRKGALVRLDLSGADYVTGVDVCTATVPGCQAYM
ncbi:MAG TPA: hypothetical protein VEJ84_12700 [Acidimicrobiales bacterium]|nr:hypothetical protein [Acidimicrobiales bacterium]